MSALYMSGGQINCPDRDPGPGERRDEREERPTRTRRKTSSPTIRAVKVVVPSTPYDAKGLLKSAIRDNDPVMFLENTVTLRGQGRGSPTGEYLIPLGSADVKRHGNRHDDRHVWQAGPPLAQRLLQPPAAGAQCLGRDRGPSALIRPLDIGDTVLASVRKTHRVLIVEEQKPFFCGVGAQIAYMIQKEAFDDLDAPVARLTTVDAPSIYSPPVETEQLPNPQRILRAALELIG